MIELREVKIGGNYHYYLFGYTKSKQFLKSAKYLGIKKLTDGKIAHEKKKFLIEMRKYPQRVDQYKKNFISVLQQIQEKKGYLPEEEIVRICKELDIPAVELFGVATFYSQFKLNKTGRFKISLCRGTACHVKKSAQLLTFLEESLGIKAGQTDQKGKFTLEVVNCIGACAKAPAMLVNSKVYGELTEDKIKEIIGGLK